MRRVFRALRSLRAGLRVRYTRLRRRDWRTRWSSPPGSDEHLAARLGILRSSTLREEAHDAPQAQDTQLEIPAELKPADGRFGCGPSKVRPEALERLAGDGSGADGNLPPPEARQGARGRGALGPCRAVLVARRATRLRSATAARPPSGTRPPSAWSSGARCTLPLASSPRSSRPSRATLPSSRIRWSSRPSRAARQVPRRSRRRSRAQTAMSTRSPGRTTRPRPA